MMTTETLIALLIHCFSAEMDRAVKNLDRNHSLYMRGCQRTLSQRSSKCKVQMKKKSSSRSQLIPESAMVHSGSCLLDDTHTLLESACP